MSLKLSELVIFHKGDHRTLVTVLFLIKGDTEAVDKFNRRLVKVTKTHAEEAKQLLQLMGIPYIDVSIDLVRRNSIMVSLPIDNINIYYIGSL